MKEPILRASHTPPRGEVPCARRAARTEPPHGRPVSLLARLADALATRRVATGISPRAPTTWAPLGRFERPTRDGFPDSGDGRAARSLEDLPRRGAPSRRARRRGTGVGRQKRIGPLRRTRRRRGDGTGREDNRGSEIPRPALAVASMLALEAGLEVPPAQTRGGGDAGPRVDERADVRGDRSGVCSSVARRARRPCRRPAGARFARVPRQGRAPRETVARPQFDAGVAIKHSRFTEASDRAVAAALIARSTRASPREPKLKPRRPARWFVSPRPTAWTPRIYEACVVFENDRRDDVGGTDVLKRTRTVDTRVHVARLFASGAPVGGT